MLTHYHIGVCELHCRQNDQLITYLSISTAVGRGRRRRRKRTFYIPLASDLKEFQSNLQLHSLSLSVTDTEESEAENVLN